LLAVPAAPLPLATGSFPLLLSPPAGTSLVLALLGCLLQSSAAAAMPACSASEIKVELLFLLYLMVFILLLLYFFPFLSFGIN
jgi:hypothetical protein